jgi:hypothetical protein
MEDKLILEGELTAWEIDGGYLGWGVEVGGENVAGKIFKFMGCEDNNPYERPAQGHIRVTIERLEVNHDPPR